MPIKCAFNDPLSGNECQEEAKYKFKHDAKASRCKLHQLEGMKNIFSNLCCHGDCIKSPIYNYIGHAAKYCILHKEPEMINVITPRCIHPGCEIQSLYNFPGQTGKYCVTHKMPGMIDVKHCGCLEEGCKKRATYNIPTESKGLYCSGHKKDGMVDVKHKFCAHKGCLTRPNYNLPGETRGTHCVVHKTKDMINVTSRTCPHPGCLKQPTFNIEGETTALYCFEHKLAGMVNVKQQTCKSEWCSTRPHDKYDGYCMFCYMNLFPDKPVARNFKTKERVVVDYITSHFPKFTWVADSRVAGGCSRRRPDLILDLGYQVVVIEVDENQHITYDCSCQNKRIMQISQDVNHRPVIFIRFNPDDYTDEKGQSVPSCWAQNGNGIMAVKKSKKKEWDARLERLREQVEYWTNPENATEKTVEIIELFYDCDCD